MKKPKKRVFNLQPELRRICQEYIINTPNLPKHIKDTAIQICSHHTILIGLELGALELIWRREMMYHTTK
ncbi:hypothetical protein LCGC14_1001680 [marine sediment metagenome]|uniref:Uncharacterized protein n=1 Tax=marine sediment metagenome TaxID=412755 RepID=A0A0F9N7L4_9ZZZZ